MISCPFILNSSLRHSLSPTTLLSFLPTFSHAHSRSRKNPFVTENLLSPRIAIRLSILTIPSMESRRLVRPSSFPPTPSGLEDSNLQGSRLPLTESAGNTASRTLASVDVYHDHKGLPPLSGENFHSHYLQPPILHSSTNIYPHPSLNHPHVVVPSQPPPPHVSSLGQRKRQHQRRRDERQLELDIRDSEQYKQYRQRQTRDGQDKDQKWSDDLEEAFLDGVLTLPRLLTRSVLTYLKLNETCLSWDGANLLTTPSLMVETS